MAKGNQIIVTSEPMGHFDEAIIDDTSLPGTIMELTPASAIVQGRFHVRAAATGTDGKAAQQLVLLEDNGQGKTITDAYVAGKRCRLYTPVPGEELNVLVGAGSGTSDTITIGQHLMLHSSGGVLMPATGTIQDEPWQSLEAITQQAPPQLLWCRKL